MDELNKVNILEMARGAVAERVDVEVGHVVENMLDLNTDAKAREINIKLKIVPSADRHNAGISALVSSKLRPLTEIQTMIYMGTDEKGLLKAVEATPQTPGQIGIDGGEQESPKVIRLGA